MAKSGRDGDSTGRDIWTGAVNPEIQVRNQSKDLCPFKT